MNHVWSYSSIDTFQTCPRKFYHRYVLKEKEPSSPALEYGNAVHKALENRIKGAPLPEVYQKFSPMAESVVNAYAKGMQVYTELKMGIKRDFSPCDFFGKEVWGRGAADVLLVQKPHALIFDWKTGKKREKDDQLKILALLVFITFPGIDTITGCNLWLEPGDVGMPYAFTRAGVPKLWQDVLVKIQAIERAFEQDAWPEKPSGLCGWCAVKQCQFNKS